MTATVSILDTVTGEAHLFADEHFNSADDTYIWEDGNYSCDCNRGLHYGRDFDEVGCGEGRYKVAIFCEGRFVYSEMGGTTQGELK